MRAPGLVWWPIAWFVLRSRPWLSAQQSGQVGPGYMSTGVGWLHEVHSLMG